MKSPVKVAVEMAARKKIIAANWKMNLTHREVKSYADVLWAEVGVVNEIEVILIPPFTAIPALAEALERNPVARLGAQNMHWERCGAFTGEISAPMLRALYVNYVVLGHSERRRLFGETDEMVNRKIIAALSAGLQPIVCVGETLAERNDERVEEVLKRQIQEGLKGVNSRHFHDLVIAYEPLWAIGTGRTATPEEAQEAHAFIRSVIASVSDPSTAARLRIQYGGSVKPENAEELLRQQDIDGALVGGASLDARSFAQIIRSAVAVSA
jgi:triosephosphate isomerase